IRADEDATVPDRRRAVDVAVCRARPEPMPGRRTEGIDLAVGRADVDAAVRDRRRRVEAAVAEEPAVPSRTPEKPARAGGDRIHMAFVGAGEEALPARGDRAFDRPARPERPLDLPGARVEVVDLPEPVADVEIGADEERRRLARADAALPAQLPRPGRDGDD